MQTYIQFTNGAVTQLVDINKEDVQQEMLDNGFYMKTDSNGKPMFTDSDELATTYNPSRAELLELVQERLAEKSRANELRKESISKYK